MRASTRLFATAALGPILALAACSAEDLDSHEPGDEKSDTFDPGAGESDDLMIEFDGIVWPHNDEEAAALCRERCDGELGVHGLSGESFCLCRTGDGGARCTAGRDCESDCLFEEFEEMGAGLGIAVGVCSEYETTFGCQIRIEDWLADLGPQRIPFDILTVCID
jgi:hypothetical protein